MVFMDPIEIFLYIIFFQITGKPPQHLHKEMKQVKQQAQDLTPDGETKWWLIIS